MVNPADIIPTHDLRDTTQRGSIDPSRNGALEMVCVCGNAYTVDPFTLVRAKQIADVFGAFFTDHVIPENEKRTLTLEWMDEVRRGSAGDS